MAGETDIIFFKDIRGVKLFRKIGEKQSGIRRTVNLMTLGAVIGLNRTVLLAGIHDNLPHFKMTIETKILERRLELFGIVG